MTYTPVTYKVIDVDDPLLDYAVRVSTPTDIATLPTARTGLPVNGLYVRDDLPTPVRITVEQERISIADNTYQVTTTVTETLGIAEEVFVYDTITETYQHVATVFDMDNYPATQAAAEDAGIPYYRLSEAVQSSIYLANAENAAAYTLLRIGLLQDAYYEYRTAFEGTDSHTYPVEE